MFQMMSSGTIPVPSRNTYRTRALVVDLGTHSVIAGTANGEQKCEIPPFILKGNRKIVGTDALQAVRKQGLQYDTALVTPFRDGTIKEFTTLNLFLKYVCFHQLYFEGASEKLLDTPVVISEPVVAGDQDAHRTQRLEMGTTFFKQFDVPAYYVAPQPVFCLARFQVRSGRGVVIDIGHSTTKVSVVFDGSTIPVCTQVSPIAGKVFEDLLFKELVGKGLRREDRFLMSKVKEDLFYVSTTIEEDKKKLEQEDEKFKATLTKKIVLEDGAEVVIDEERFLIPETLFHPTMSSIGYSSKESLISMIRTAKKKYEAYRISHARANPAFLELEAYSVFRNFVIVGGSTKMPGLIRRIELEVAELMVNYELEHSGTDPSQVVEQETRRDIRDRLGLHFYSEPNLVDRGQEAFNGAIAFSQTVANDVWVQDVNVDDSGIEVLVDRCPK